jgi:hypothetical protein
MKINRKKNSYEIVKLKSEIIIFKLSLEWVKDDHMTKMVM